MEEQEFQMYHKSTSTPVKVKLQQEDEVYFVSIDDNFLGSMEIDLESEFGFTTTDEQLQEYIEGISLALGEETEKHLFALLLLGKYGQNIIRHKFINDDVLELIAHKDTDIEEFGNVILDQIYDHVTFESKLSVVLSKEGDDYTFNFDIN